MILKNNTKANVQFFVRVNPKEVIETINQFGNKMVTPAKPEVKLIHIPGEATVEIDDDLYEALANTTTTVSGYRDVVTEIEGADVTMVGEQLSITERLPDGTTREVNLFKQLIKEHTLILITEEEKETLTNEQIIEELSGMGVTLASGMSTEQIRNLYERLKGTYI